MPCRREDWEGKSIEQGATAVDVRRQVTSNWSRYSVSLNRLQGQVMVQVMNPMMVVRACHLKMFLVVM